MDNSKTKEFVNINANGSTFDSILLLNKNSFYSQVLNQMITNVIEQNLSLYQNLIKVYNLVIPSCNIKLNKNDIKNILNTYISPMAYRAASGRRDLAILTYMDLIIYMANILKVDINSANKIEINELKAKTLELKKEAA